MDGTKNATDDDSDENLIRLPVRADDGDSDTTDGDEGGDAVADAEMPRSSERVRKLRECAICK